MARDIISVGFQFPGGEIEHVPLLSDRSLLDADIIIFEPGIPSTYGSDTYQGKECLSDDSSFRVREALAHWRRELAAAIDAGKLVIVFLDRPEVVFAATGEKTYSGTGRNARTTRIVTELPAYSAIPTKWSYVSATGTEMVLAPDARHLASYWSEFSEYSEYRLYLQGEIAAPVLRTRTGNRTVGANILKGKGGLIALPPLNLEREMFVESRSVSGVEKQYWTSDAKKFGKKLVTAVVALADALASSAVITPAPDWSTADEFRLAAEATLHAEIGRLSQEVLELEDQRRSAESRLAEVSSLRRLLYEQGKPLEAEVLRALRVFGFTASGFREGGSEFDAVFISAEGRFIGEVEGKDAKAINIDKFSQLERNINEDFARDEITNHAKGVLFGNAYRFNKPADRAAPFTEKCLTAAKRLNVALVHTPDMFLPCKYLQEHADTRYATSCRTAIFNSVGDIVVFPDPPAGDAISEASVAGAQP